MTPIEEAIAAVKSHRKRFAQNTTDDQDSRESSTSILSGSDWRKIDRLIQSAVQKQSSEDNHKLSRSFHHISIQHELLRHEITGLREALLVKKRHKKHSKPLDLQQRTEYHGGAVFWSPRKLREARARQVIKDRTKDELRLQKAETAKLREASKLYKDKMAQEKRVAREAAKEAREKEKAQKVAERARQREAQNAERAIQLSQKGKRKASKPTIQSNKRQKSVVEVVGGGESSKATSATPPITTRYGRNTKLPSKYR